MMSNKYQRVLNEILKNEQQWVRVHAAEYLLWKGLDREMVYENFKLEETSFDTVIPYRIGIWRVLFQASSNLTEKQEFLNKLVNAYLNGPDKLHAIETLSKLNFPLSAIDSNIRTILNNTNELSPMYLYRLWNLYLDNYAERPKIIDVLLDVLISSDLTDNLKQISCFILRFITLDDNSKASFRNLEIGQSSETVRLQYLVTLFTIGFESEEEYRGRLDELLSFDNDFQNFSSIMLALSGSKDPSEVTILKRLYAQIADGRNVQFTPDIFATAAFCMLN